MTPSFFAFIPLLTVIALVATHGAAARALASPQDPQAPEGFRQTWIGTRTPDEQTTETAIVEDEIRKAKRTRPRTQPFRIEVLTDIRCDIPEIPNFPAGPFLKDYFEGHEYDVYVVDPKQVDPATGRWRRSPTGEIACRLLPPAPERAPTSVALRNQVTDLIVLPSPGLGVSPTGRGLTGLSVRLWAEDVPTDWLAFPPTVLDGKQVEVQARPTGYTWDTGDSGTSAPQSTYSTDGPGSPDVPAVTHVYETKSSVGRPAEGVYTIRLDVIWARRYRVVGIVDACNDWCDVDPGKTSASRAYQVEEVRGILTG